MPTAHKFTSLNTLFQAPKPYIQLVTCLHPECCKSSSYQIFSESNYRNSSLCSLAWLEKPVFFPAFSMLKPLYHLVMQAGNLGVIFIISSFYPWQAQLVSLGQLIKSPNWYTHIHSGFLTFVFSVIAREIFFKNLSGHVSMIVPLPISSVSSHTKIIHLYQSGFQQKSHGIIKLDNLWRA